MHNTDDSSAVLHLVKYLTFQLSTCLFEDKAFVKVLLAQFLPNSDTEQCCESSGNVSNSEMLITTSGEALSSIVCEHTLILAKHNWFWIYLKICTKN